MSFIIRNLTAGTVTIDDLGMEFAASADVDFLPEPAQDVAKSADLVAQITAGNLIVLDPNDGVTPLSSADSIKVVQVHNDPHWGINGADLNDLDDVNITTVNNGDLIQWNGSTWVNVTPATVAGGMDLDDLGDVDDATPHTTNIPYVFVGDGTNLDVVDATTDVNFIEAIQDHVGGMIGTTTDLTINYNDGTGNLDYSVDDSYLRNDGDTLDSGTLTIATGASVVVQTGATLTLTDLPTSGTDAANKTYVDSIAAGRDPKESVRVASTGDVGGTYNATGGTGGTGEFTNVDLTNADGISLNVGDRYLIKDQPDPKQNGIYVVTTAGVTGVIERASDHDGSPASEVSAGNATFVEVGTVNNNTGWIVVGDGQLTLNTDNIVWTQDSGLGTFLAGAGLALNGNIFSLDVDNLTTATAVAADEIAFNDISDSTTTRKTTFSNLISDLNIYTSSNLTASDGVLINAGDIQLDITNLTATTITGVDELVFDNGGTGAHAKTTVTSFLADLNIVNNIGNGIAVQTGADTYVARSVVESTVAGQEGGQVNNGDGIAGNIEIGVDINNAAASASNMLATDEFLGYNSTNNVSFTGLQIAQGVSTILGGLGNSYTTITGDTGSSAAASSTDTLTFIGAVNGGITTVAANGAPDSVTFAMDVADLTVGAGTLLLTDDFAVNDGGSTLRYTFQKMVDDLDIVNGITTNGMLVRTANDTYVSRSIAVDGVGNKDGLTVANADGVAGNPTVGLDITGTPAAGEDMSATDEFVMYNTSATANEKVTGQEIADGVTNILNISGLTVTNIGGQLVLTLIDTTRANKVLSVESTAFKWAENQIGNNDWLMIADANDADTGYIVPLDSTVVKMTAHTEHNNGNAKNIHLYVDGVDQGAVVNFAGAAGQDTDVDVTLNIDVNAGQKLRLRGDATGGSIQDTVIVLWTKFRGA